MRLSQVVDALRELAGELFLSAYIAQVREERHGSVTVARTLHANKRVDLLPGLAFSLRQADQISIAGDLFLSFAPHASPSLPLAGNLVSRLRHRLGALPQCAGRAQRQGSRVRWCMPSKPAHDFGTDTPVATRHAREQRDVLIGTEAGQPSFDAPG